MDAEGRTHFSDREPEDQDREVQSVNVPEGEAEADPQLSEQRERGRRLLQVWDQEREQKDREANARAVEQAQLDERCRRATAELEQVSRARYLYRRGENGERDVLERDEREQYSSELESWIASHCG